MSDRIAEMLEEELVALAGAGGGGGRRPAELPSAAAKQSDASTAMTPAHPHPPSLRASGGEARDQLLLARSGASGPGAAGAVTIPPISIDTVVVSGTGGVFVVGWVDDAADRVDVVRVTGNGWRVAFDGTGLARVRRKDVETALGSGLHHPYGFWGFVYGKHPINARGGCTVEVVLRNGATQVITATVRAVEDVEIRNLVLTYLVGSEYFGAGHVEAIACLEAVIGEQILGLNRAISRLISSRPHVERFVSPQRKCRGSLVICLYGRPEFTFLQNAAFFQTAGMDEYEIVFVSNSPELAEQLLKEARNAHLIYGINQSVVLLTGNAGFGAANNVAVNHCNSDRVLIVNPDVFPAQADWAARHSQVLDELPDAQTRLFGVPLYYNDGSLMHGGMYFEVDPGLSLNQSGVRRRQMVRVEHYGKGAPPGTPHFLRPRPVPAVTGAFMSVDRGWFETLGGFTEDYVFGHYEDADLCLKSLRHGHASWLHDIRLWHLEGKGSSRLPVHDGGSVVNRWLFSQRWIADIDPALIGPAPAHPAFAPAPETPATAETDAGTHTGTGIGGDAPPGVEAPIEAAAPVVTSAVVRPARVADAAPSKSARRPRASARSGA